ncbi:MAG: helix-turn-helix transcriptional regulator [Solirubrobacteraceae bacterium]|nr:helix-turn-helix transcriptional regulator [Solirubrobacteraceae bacterium]
MSEPIPHPLPEPVIELVAQRFRVLAEPMRIRILEALRDGEASVQELTASVGASQQNVSKHLGVLHQSGIVSRRKEGTFVRYAVADPGVYALCELVCGDLQRHAATLDEVLRGAA